MCTKYAEIFDRLSRPFRDTVEPEVKVRTQAGRKMRYITARTAMNRLDEVLGPENWWDDYTPMQDSVICRLSIRLPDGQILTKVDAGGCAGMSDAGDDDKSGFSDAFKRAAVKFGVGRYLYCDGVPVLSPVSTPEAAKPPPKPTPKPAPRAPEEIPDGEIWDDAPIPVAPPPPVMSAAEFYEHVKRTGQLRALRAIQENSGYPRAVSQWSAEQVRTAFERLPAQVAANGAAN